MAHDNAVLRQIIAKVVFSGGSDRLETTILERNTPFSDRETRERSYWHSNFQHILTVCETPDSLLASWFQSRLASLFSCIQPRLLSFLGCHYSRVLRHFRKATWLDRQHSGGGNKNGIGHSPDQFFPCGEKWSGNETRASIHAIDNSLVRPLNSFTHGCTGVRHAPCLASIC